MCYYRFIESYQTRETVSLSFSLEKKKKKSLEINLKSFNSYLTLTPLDLGGDRPLEAVLSKKKKKKK